MPRRAFTLLELLVALALVVVIAGLALPAIWTRLGDARADGAVRLLGAAIVAARAEAQQSGEPLELVALATREGEALVIRPVSTQGEDQREARREPPAAVHPWGVMPLGVTIELVPPPDPSDERATAAKAAGRDDSPRRIAVFMPDGAVAGTAGSYLIIDQTVYRVRLNRWTGAATLSEYRHDSELDAEDELPVPPRTEAAP